MKKIRKHIKKVALLLLSIQVLEMVYPLTALALTGGPTMPEVQQFSQADNEQLVNLFSGDLNYTIPLLDVGGNPISISYNSDAVKMESEASNVGLGWNLDVGSISRDVRGLPDDFNGEKIRKETNMKAEQEGGAALGFDVEFTGFSIGNVAGGIELGVSRNNYTGWEIDFGMSQENKISSGAGDNSLDGSLSQGFSLNNKSGSGFDASFSGKMKNSSNKAELGIGVNLDVNSRDGIKSLGIRSSLKGSSKIGNGEDARWVSKGANFNFPISFSSPTYSPYFEVPRNTDAISWSLKLGGEVPLTHLSGTLKGHYSKNYIQQPVDSVPAFGYIYAQNSTGGRELLDFNREKDRSFSAELPNLPVTQFTHDVYTVNGQGVGGSFRPFRSDCGTLHDASTYQNSTAGNIGGEIGAGQLVKGGVDAKIIYTHSESKKWTGGNSFNDKFDFKRNTTPGYEPVYFKNMGEATAMANPEQFSNNGDFRPIRAAVNNNGTTTGELLFKNGEPVAGFTAENVAKKNREHRNTLFSYLTASEAAHNGVDRMIKSYPPGISPVVADGNNVPNDLMPNYYARNTGYRKNNHLSEITVTRNDGARYIYGLPAYTLGSKDVSFNISGGAAPDANKLVAYVPGVDNKSRNTRGIDHFFEAENTPGYAYAWMLTNVLSDDYVDLTGDGPTADDLGTFTKFNYTCVNNNYKWRIPFEQNKASFQENSKSDENDNYAHYSCGATEIWATHSIETKNFVAEFFYSARKDAVGVADENGGISRSGSLQKLDSIKLYSKSERLVKGDAAIPLKKVALTYSYDLCKGIPNTTEPGGGKLTLTGIYFTYGNSEKGKLSPYRFTYSETNPDYKPKQVDKWGNYVKKEEGEDAATYSALPKDKADKYASAWLLTGIRTPEASQLNIYYESDDYAYVQNKTAMEMYTLKGLTTEAAKNDAPAAGTDGTTYTGSEVFNYAKFELKTPTATQADLERYFTGIQELFFTAQMDLSSNHGKFEKVDGFIPVTLTTYNTDYGFCTGGERTADGKYKYAWVKLPRLHAGDANSEEANGVHPMAKAAWQKIRKSMPEMIYDDPDPMTDDPAAFAASMINALQSIEGFYRDANAVLANGSHASRIKLDKSKLRLCSPDMKKFGGGARVKKVTVSDSWADMTGVAGTTSTYGTEYFYTTTENLNGRETEVSSGVNAYEPATNADENPFTLPTRYNIEKPLSIDYSLYFTGPVGEVFFPGAGIGYSKVKVRSILHERVTKNATGFSVNEFYTAKDFPTITAQTDLQVNPKEVPIPPHYSEKQATVSQGFAIELNNMHGQQKAVRVFQQTDSINPISGQQFYYKTDGRGKLSNWVPQVDGATGNVRYGYQGVEYELYADARESVAETYGPSAEINVDGFLAAMIPITVPMVYPNMNYVFKRYCALTFTKVIHRSGILDRVVSFNNGTNAAVHTALYDKQTGEAVVTESENEFGAKEYATNIPAYWINSGMDAAYKNQGLKTDINIGVPANYQPLFNEGDELLIHNYTSFVPVVIPGTGGRTVAEPPKKAWVLNVNPVAISLIDAQGNPITTAGKYSVEVLRSGRKNNLDKTAASVLSLTNPVVTSGSTMRFAIPATGIINANASEFSNLWQTYAAFQATQPQYQCNCKPFAVKGGSAGLPGGQTTASSALEQFLRTLLVSGNFSQTGVSLSGSAYTAFSSFLNVTFGSGTKTYNGLKGSTQFTGQIVNSDTTSCSITMQMADGRTLFPDSVIDFRMDLSLTDSSDRAACDDANSALGIITYKGIQGNATARVRVTTSCFPILICREKYVGEGSLNCSATGTGTINPYISGVLGSWRKKSDYNYRSERQGTTVTTGGTLRDFSSFFTEVFPLRAKPVAERTNWQLSATATVYDPFGRNIESKNGLGIYSNEVFGYGFSLPVLSAKNSRYMNVAFDGFEDYQYKNAADNPWNSCPVLPHFKFDTATAKIDRNVSHTGYSSLRTAASVSLTRSFYTYTDATESRIEGGRFIASRDNLIQPYTPDADTCIFSAWVSKGVPGATSGVVSTGSTGSATLPSSNVLQNIGNYLNNSLVPLTGGLGGVLGGSLTGSATNQVVIKATTNTGAEVVLASVNSEGKSIDGWKQINAVFTIPPNVRSITVQLNPGGTAWYDDMRIQPFNSSMKAFVYDPYSLRLMATLDENNYAAMYEYDNEGKLVRNKKETEDNIITLQETRSSKSKTR